METTQLVIAALIALVVIGFVAWPMVRGRMGRAGAAQGQPTDDAAIEARIRDYRAALRRGTVCDRCLYANTEASRFCAQCGSRLPATSSGSAAAPTDVA